MQYNFHAILQPDKRLWSKGIAERRFGKTFLVQGDEDFVGIAMSHVFDLFSN